MNKINLNSNRKSKNITFSKKLNNNNKNTISERKKIIINDINKNYTNTPEIRKIFQEKIKLNKLYLRLNTESNNTRFNLMNNTISEFKLNITKNTLKKNQKIIKPYLNEKDLKPIEKKKVTTSIIKNKNKKNKFGFGDSYEFNFTFNNYNNNFTQDNINNTELKNINKKKNNIFIENLANKTIINDLTSMRNNILKDIKDIFIKDKNTKEKSQDNKIGKIGDIFSEKNINSFIKKIKMKKLILILEYMLEKKY